MRGIVAAVLILGAAAAASAQDQPGTEPAAAGCRFSTSGSVMRLLADCTTDVSIEIPDGVTLDGNGRAIIAIDPADEGFRGGVVVGRGRSASVINATILAVLRTEGCQQGADRLRGIYFEGASGIIRDNVVDSIARGRSACHEGNAIEVRNPAGAPRTVVEIVGNAVGAYQKSGVVVHGPVDAFIYSNEIGASAAQDRVPANALQVGPDAHGTIHGNTISGNTFAGPDAAGTAILLIDTLPGTLVSTNAIVGSGDVGIHVLADGVIVEDNQISDAGPDGAYDVGIVNLGEGNTFGNNRISGYRTRYYGLETAVTGNGRSVE
jgi:hypothetical protein